MSNILVVNANVDERKAMADACATRGRRTLSAGSIEEALHTLASEEVEYVVSVRTLPDGSGEFLAQQAKEVSPSSKILLTTNFSEIRDASDILRFDFTDYILDVHDLAGMVSGSKAAPSPTHRSLIECFLKTVEAVVGLVELTNPDTAGISASSLRLAEAVAREMGVPEEQRQEVSLAALLHDIGNFDVKSGVLAKVDPLVPEEEEAIRQHTARGAQLLDHIDFPWRIKPIILHHHERYDGSGYPDGKKGRTIPVGARILSVVDAYLAMTTKRPHRQTIPHEQAVQELQARVGSQFDPEVVEAFVHFVSRRKQFAGDMFQVKVLVLEGVDQRLARLKLQFVREDFKVLTAQTAAQARELTVGEDIRFLVADVTNQWDVGLELLEAFQDRIDSFQTSVLFFDGEDSRERRLTALDNGAEEVFPADVSIAEILSRMRRTLRKDQAARRATLGREESGIQGELAQMNLPEILQMLSMGHKTAKIVLKTKGRAGVLFLESGRLTHADCDEVEGHQALTRLLGMESGNFAISHGVTSEKRTIDRDAMSVLLDALRSMDETAHADDGPPAKKKKAKTKPAPRA